MIAIVSNIPIIYTIVSEQGLLMQYSKYKFKFTIRTTVVIKNNSNSFIPFFVIVK